MTRALRRTRGIVRKGTVKAGGDAGPLGVMTMNLIGYVCISTEEQAREGVSLDARSQAVLGGTWEKSASRWVTFCGGVSQIKLHSQPRRFGNQLAVLHESET